MSTNRNPPSPVSVSDFWEKENGDLDTEPVLSPSFSEFKEFIVPTLMCHLCVKISELIIYIFLKIKGCLLAFHSWAIGLRSSVCCSSNTKNICLCNFTVVSKRNDANVCNNPLTWFLLFTDRQNNELH